MRNIATILCTLSFMTVFFFCQYVHAKESRITNEFAVSLVKEYLRENAFNNVKRVNSVEIKPKHHDQLELSVDLDVKYKKITLPGVKVAIDVSLQQSDGILITFNNVRVSYLGLLGDSITSIAEDKIEKILQKDLGDVELKNAPFHIRVLKNGDFLVVAGKRNELEEMIIWDDWATPYDESIAKAKLRGDNEEVERLAKEKAEWKKETNNEKQHVP